LQEATLTIERQAELIDLIVRELSIHDGIEKQLLYPALGARVEGGKAMAAGGLREHQKVEELLAEVERTDPGSDDALRLMRQTMDNVHEHVAEEEAVMFPALRAAMSSEELFELGGQLGAAKSIAPTHAHPASPNMGASAAIVGTLSGIVDHTKDALSGRPSDA
jgi:hemerythrin-like domain-containing protein